MNNETLETNETKEMKAELNMLQFKIMYIEGLLQGGKKGSKAKALKEIDEIYWSLKKINRSL